MIPSGAFQNAASLLLLETSVHERMYRWVRTRMLARFHCCARFTGDASGSRRFRVSIPLQLNRNAKRLLDVLLESRTDSSRCNGLIDEYLLYPPQSAIVVLMILSRLR